MELESPGHVELEELQRLSRSVHAGWRLARVRSPLWDMGPSVTLMASPARIVARSDGELAGAVAIAADPVISHLYGRDTWRIAALVARDTETETALLLDASRTAGDRDLLYFRFSEIGDVPSIAASGFTVIGRGATLGTTVEELHGTMEAQHPRDPDDREALLSIVRESAEHPVGTVDLASLERSRESNADSVAAALSQPGLVVVTREASRITGFAVLSRVSRHGCIDLLGVAQSDRRRGFGARLVAAAAAVGRREGWDCLLVATSRENDAAMRLYGSSGFRELGDIVLMHRLGTAPGASPFVAQ